VKEILLASSPSEVSFGKCCFDTGNPKGEMITLRGGESEGPTGGGLATGTLKKVDCTQSLSGKPKALNGKKG